MVLLYFVCSSEHFDRWHRWMLQKQLSLSQVAVKIQTKP